MTLKATWLWNGTTEAGRRTFGFSETWYTDDAPALLLPKMAAFASNRVDMMAFDVALYGYRIADTSPGSRAYVVKPQSPIIQLGRTVDPPNIPADAALCQCSGQVAGTTKRFFFHCLPDGAVVDSLFAAAYNIPGQARTLINLLANNGFKFRYTVQNSPKASINSIDAAGNVVLQQPLAGVALYSIVQLFHVRGTDGRGKRGKFMVTAFTDNQHFQLGGYGLGTVGASGQLRITQYAYTNITPVPAVGLLSDPTIRPAVRKVGRPFGLSRGRAIARR